MPQQKPRPVGRPPAENPRHENLSGVRVSRKELERLQQIAVKDNPQVSFSAWVRQTLFEREAHTGARNRRRRRGADVAA